jgi:vacuolar protein sorting-associated protein 51
MDSMNIDHPDFHVHAYVDKRIREHGLNDVLSETTGLKNEIRQLSGDLQMLVYENYSKFIYATDVVKRMKGNLDSIQDEITNLLGSINRVHPLNKTFKGICSHNATDLQVGISS